MNKRIVFMALLTCVLAAGVSYAQLSYFPLTPCRVVDTRNPAGVNGGPTMASNAQRDFSIRGNCGVPLTAQAITVNVTVANATQTSWLALWPSGTGRPLVSTINFTASDPSLANGATVPLSSNAQDLSVYNNFGTVNVILDVTGYYQ